MKHKKRLEFGEQIECVFWDFETENWSSEGCRIDLYESNRIKTICICNSLAYFAALKYADGNNDIKILTYISFGISNIFLLSTLLTLIFMVFKSKTLIIINRRLKIRNSITFNICFFSFIINVIIISLLHGVYKNVKVEN